MNRVLASFTSGERNIIAFVLAMVAGGYGLVEWQSGRQKTMSFSAAPTAEIKELNVPAAMPTGMDSGGLVNINVADGKVLETLPGIGPSLAGAIIRHRTGNGPILSMSELDEVPGIGPSMMAKLSSLVTFDTTGTTVASVPEPITAPVVSGFAPVPGFTALASPQSNIRALPASSASININKADSTELDKLKGIGPALAQRIIQDRQQRGLFRSSEELLRVKGVGPKILQDNRNRLSVN